MVASQFPVDHWHQVRGDPTPADAILDRLLHTAYKIPRSGDSMRQQHAIVNNDVPTTSPLRSDGATDGGSFRPDWVAGITGICP